jgi:geranylgeranyl pyrophosphate synthase
MAKLPMKKIESADSLTHLLAPYARRSEQYIEHWLVEEAAPQTLQESMRYCVFNGGKRLRCSLVLLTAEAAGGDAEDELTARAAVAVELVHCYSLIHDDLPSMDNDELRRGKPTAHVKFGEAMAILAGDALLTRAFAILGESVDERASALVRELGAAAGPAGMVAGQVADMDLCEVPIGIEGLDYIHKRKTAALIRAAGRMGAICVGAEDSVLAAISDYAESLGMAFQLVDDTLDVTGELETLGKTPGKDLTSQKRTHVAELGIERARELIDELTDRAVEAIGPLGDRGHKLRMLVKLLAQRHR